MTLILTSTLVQFFKTYVINSSCPWKLESKITNKAGNFWNEEFAQIKSDMTLSEEGAKFGFYILILHFY